MTARQSRWFTRPPRPVQHACRIFCFPYAGGSASIYRGWQDALPKSVELLAIELPGRGAHFSAPPIASLDALVAQLVDVIAPLLDVPTFFFGHSNGALIAYALTVELMKREMALPHSIILSGKLPPHLDCKEALHDLPTPQFVEKLRSLNGTSTEVLSNSALLEVLLPCLRADFALSETYRHAPCPLLPCKASLMGGHADLDISVEELKEWSRYFSATPTVHMFEGDHFFVHSAKEHILPILREYVIDCLVEASQRPNA
jgi:medium-chain acyl-[acyl-carrier-protein] hydrolase